MHTYYGDILSRISEPPNWWDEHAVPRFNRFSPRHVADIYASECALLRIRCQSCRTVFRVALSWYKNSGEESLTDRIRKGHAFYGDPPHSGCCLSGPSMTSDPVRVLQFWSRLNKQRRWARDKSLEVALPD